MVEMERRLALKKLDREMRPFRWAGREPNPTNALLRTVRQALAIPVKEIAAKMGVGRSALLALEVSERDRTISMRSLARMAEAMGCKVVYGVVPVNGKSLEDVVEARLWKKVLSTGNKGTRERGTGG